MKKILIVVDMQNDFITGSLGSKEAVAIVPKVRAKIEKAVENNDYIFCTLDTHYENYLETNEGKHLPVEHCKIATEGWQIERSLEEVLPKDCLKITKKTFGYDNWSFLIQSILDEEEIEKIELVGLCTDICVVSNALVLKALFPEMNITVDASCCAGVTPETHKAALTTMKMCQIDIENESEEV